VHADQRTMISVEMAALSRAFALHPKRALF